MLEEVESLNVPDVLSKSKDIIQNSLQRINYLYKSNAYSYEKECRIIVPSDTDLDTKVQHKEGTFKHYVQHPALSTSEETGIFRSGSAITIGPCVESQKAAKQYLENLIYKAGIHTAVRTSKISYRRSGNH